MATKRRSSREPEVATDSPFAPAIAEMRRVARMLGVSVAAADADDSPQATASRRNVRLTAHALAILRGLCAQGSLAATARAARSGPLTLEEAVAGGWVTRPAAARLEAYARSRCACVDCAPPPPARPEVAS